MTAVRTEYDSLYIGGQWRPPAGDERITVVSPHTGEPIGSVPSATGQGCGPRCRGSPSSLRRLSLAAPRSQRAGGRGHAAPRRLPGTGGGHDRDRHRRDGVTALVR